jgi:hypothetical protein
VPEQESDHVGVIEFCGHVNRSLAFGARQPEYSRVSLDKFANCGPIIVPDRVEELGQVD